MEQNDDIAYKAWVENLREPAPEGAWSAIADQLDIDAAWDGISESLDIDDVWHNIEAELPQAVPVSNTAPTQLPKLFWLAAALVLLTLTTPLTEERVGREQPLSEQRTAEVKTGAQSEKKPEQQADFHIEPETANTDRSDNRTNAQVATNNKKYPNAIRSNAKDMDTKPPAKLNDEQLVINEVPARNVLQPAITTGTISKKREVVVLSDRTIEKSVIPVTKPQVDTLAIVENKSETDSVITVTGTESQIDTVQRRLPQRATWYVGVIGSLKNTWLINPETANGLKSESLNDTRVTFGKEFGVTVQRSLGGMSDLQVEYYFYSEIGQRYHEYINALYQTKDIRLRYQKFQVLYRTRIFRNINAPALYATGGIRVSRLTLADTSIGNESQEVTQEYRPWDYGFILGTEAEFKLSNKFVLVSGLRGSYGLRNIYLGTSQVPAEFNKTRTASVGLMLGLKYRIN